MADEPALSPDDSAEVRHLIVARVLRAHGTSGELACEIITEFPQRFRKTKRVFLSPSTGPGRVEIDTSTPPAPHEVIHARVMERKGHAELVLELAGVGDRDAAEALRGWLVQVPETEAWTLPRGRFYWHQIIGLRVITTDGEELGTVTDILETGANDVYVVRGGDRERLLPAIKQVVKKIAPDEGQMVVTLLPGL